MPAATASDLHMQLQSISVWNLIPDDRLPPARAALREFCARGRMVAWSRAR